MRLLKKYFTKEGEFYRIHKEIRDCVVFSVQDIIKDPPFSKLNLLCCRNLLIYLNTDAQKKVLPLFHYTLKPGGILVLGSSETIGGFTNLFETLDRKWKIFKRKEVPQAFRQIVNFPSGTSGIKKIDEAVQEFPAKQKIDINQLTQQAVLDQFSPTAILTDDKGEILNIQGRSGKYLEPPSGSPTNNILNLAREGLRIDLSSALRVARSSSKIETRKKLSVKTNGNLQLINLHVCPLNKPKELAGRFLVVFEDIDSEPTAESSNQSDMDNSLPDFQRLTELERELQITREIHQTTLEELESSNEELKSTNEEMQSANEELQSTNEELESSKEELQSLNEELQTVNAELQSKVDDLSAAQDDMRNLLNSTEIATIFVDNDLRVRRFTPGSTTIINLIQTDIGRPLQHVVSNLKYDRMITDVTKVIEKLTTKVEEVQTTDGQWFNMRVLPYRTVDNRIDGAVLTFSSIADQKRDHRQLQNSMQEMENAWALVRSIFDMNEDPMVVLDKKGKLVIANMGYSKLMKTAQKNLEGTDFIKSLTQLSKQSDIKENLINALNRDKDFTTKAFDMITPTGKLQFAVQGLIINKEKNFPHCILLKFVKQ